GRCRPAPPVAPAIRISPVAIPLRKTAACRRPKHFDQHDGGLMAAGHPFRQAKSGAPAEAGPPPFSCIRSGARHQALERKLSLEFQRAVGCDVGQTELVADIHREFRTWGLRSVAFGVVVIALADVARLLVLDTATGLPEQ